MIRAIIRSVWEGAIKRVTAAGRSDETIINREYMQHYGLTSRPLKGAEGVIINDGNHFIMIASDDRRYRIALEAGEVALYTDEGDSIHLQRNRKIVVTGGAEVTVLSPNINLGDIRTALRRLIDERMRELHNAHTHDHGSVPDRQLTADDCCTSVVEAK